MNKKIYTNYQLNSLDEVINTGTLFKNIYKPYKKTPKIVPETKEENLLLKIQAYEIALMDLNLYLDVFENDNSLTNLFKQYVDEKEKLVKEFEKEYYPLSPKCSADNNKWEWVNGKWPWEGDHNV